MRHPLQAALAVMLIAAAIGCPHPAAAWQSGPWDGAAFDQPGGMTASTSARIAGAIAQGQAFAGTNPIVVGDKPTNNVITGPSGCQVNIGGISLPPGGSINNSNVTLNTNNNNSNNIVICK